MTIDAVEWLAEAMELLPERPADVTADDFARIAAMSRGIVQHIAGIRSATDALEAAVAEAKVPACELARDADWLIALRRRAEHAHDLLSTYLAAAIRARGLDPAALTAGDDIKERTDAQHER